MGIYSVFIWKQLPIFNPKPLLPDMNSYTKFDKKNCQ